MRDLKSAFDMIRAFLPVIYFAGLFFYFFQVSGGSIETANMIGLGPTLLGLAIVGLIFCIPLAIKLVRLFGSPRPPRSGGGSAAEDDDTFDADAVVARYMAQRSSQAASALTTRRETKTPVPARPSGFGRRTS